MTGLQVHRERDLSAVLAEWDGLYEGDSTATPFACPEWVAPWCAHWSDQGRPWLLAIRERGRLAGLAAFVLARRGPVRVLRGLGTVVGNYWDILAADAMRPSVTAAVMDGLHRHGDEWDLLSADRLPPGSRTATAFVAAGLGLQRRRPVLAPWLDLPPTFDDYLGRLSSNRRAKVRRYLRPLDTGHVELRTVVEPARLRDAVRRWQELRVAWWRSRDRPLNPEHASRRFLEFTTDAVLGMVPAGRAVVWDFRLEDETIGVAINFIDGETFYYWLSGFDPRFEALRLGHAVVAQGIRWSIESGRSGFDFMVGTEAYKYEYRAQDRELGSVTVSNHRARSRLAGAALARRRSLRGWSSSARTSRR